MTVTTSETTLLTLTDALERSVFTIGAIAMQTRVIRLLSSMGEHDLAATIGRMDVPTRENWNEREAAASQENA